MSLQGWGTRACGSPVREPSAGAQAGAQSSGGQGARHPVCSAIHLRKSCEPPSTGKINNAGFP